MPKPDTTASSLRMTSEQFGAWVLEQPEGRHFELYRGEVVPIPPERALHAITKTLIGRRLGNGIEALGLDCTVIVDDFVVRVDATTSFEPDVVVCCGPPPPDDALWIDNPVIIVEVLSPSTRDLDKTRKRAAYMQLPSLRHYLIVDADERTVTHHARDAGGAIMTRTVGEEPIALDPPGLLLDRFLPTR